MVRVRAVRVTSEEGDMKTYVVVSGALFGLLTAVHIWRFIVERSVGTDPFFLTVTTISTVLAIWAARLVTRTPRP